MSNYDNRKYTAHKRKNDGKIQTVDEHQKGTATLSRIFGRKIGLANAGELIGLLHDLGKYSSDFQEYFSEEILSWTDPTIKRRWKRGSVDHSTAGAQYIWNTADKNDKALLYLIQILSLCISSHHSGLIDCLAPDGEDKFTKRIKKDSERTHFIEVVEKCNKNILNKIDALIKTPQTLSEFIDVMKQVMDGKTKTVQLFRAGLLTRFLFSCLIDADRTDTADFENPENAELRQHSRYPAWGEFITVLEQRLEQFETRNHVDEIRHDVSLSCKQFGEREQGIYTLTVPTGGGKTLASLRFALEHAQNHKLNRIFFIIPYTSIIDQNAHEVRQIFAELSEKYKNELVLEHHSNLTPDKDTLQSKILAENWDAPIVYTTSVQLLESFFNSGTRGVRRMHQLAESVIVFDEIQTLPVRLTHLFNNAMNFLVDICKSSVVLCTATQPCLHDVDTEKGAIQLTKDPEIMPNVSKLFYDLRRVEVIDQRKPGGLSTAEIAELTKCELIKSGSVLVVVNTKQSARDLFRCCRDFDAKIFHLSTDMCPVHRMIILAKIRSSLEPNNSTPIVCISTQLIEAGVDVDFGSVIRYLAGCDSIAQAAGRCNRNGLRKIGRVTIVNPKDENIGSLIDIEVGREIAQRVLDECAKDKDALNSDLLHPDVMNRFFQYYFYDRKAEMGYPVSKKIVNQSETLLRLLSTNNESLQNYLRAYGKHPDYPLRHSFNSAAKAFKAIDSETQGVIVPYKKGKEIIAKLCASNNILKEYALMKTAQRFSVNCYQNRIMKLGIGEAGALHDIQGSGILCLKPEHYSRDFGVSDEPVTDQFELMTA